MRAGDAVPTGLVPCLERGRGHADSRGSVVLPNASVIISCPRICLTALERAFSVSNLGFRVNFCVQSTEGPRPEHGTSCTER